MGNKTTIQALFLTLTKEQLGTPTARFKADDDKIFTLIGKINEDCYVIDSGDEGIDVADNPSWGIEYPVEEEKEEEIWYPCLVKCGGALVIEYFEDELEAGTAYPRGQVIKWNPEGYETIPPTKNKD